MGIFANILNKIFHHAAAPPPAQPSPASPAQPATPVAPQAPQGAAPTPAPAQPVDVEAVLNDLASKNPQQLNWRSSIVDLMKLLDLDSSLAARKELAQELGYKGDMGDSAAMNVWLHGQVMTKLEQNGGKVPADLKG